MEPTAQDLLTFETKLTEGKHKLAEKAAQDASFHDALTKNPKETIEKFFDLPEGTLKDVTVEIFEEKPKTIGIALPPRPQDAGAELSEQQLEAVAGGAAFAGVAMGVVFVGSAVGAGAGAYGLSRRW